jgi:glutaminase
MIHAYLKMLESHGLRRTDYRLKELFCSLKRILKEAEVAHRGHMNDDFIGSIETLQLSREVFANCIIPNIIVISAAFRNQFVIPKFDVFTQQIEFLYNECKEINVGVHTPYLKQLEKFDAADWGVSLCTIDGQRFSIGDTNTPVTLHSIR